MANFVVIARFGDEMTNRIAVLQKALYDGGALNALTSWPPHITIAAYEGIEQDALLRWTEGFSALHGSLEIDLSSLGLLPPAGEYPNSALLFASPSPSKALIDFYYAFHEELDEFCGKLGWLYSASCAQPYPIHATIGALDVTQLQKAMELTLLLRPFGLTRITALEAYTYPMELIRRFELNP
jgi:2'-5' RNA ligase